MAVVGALSCRYRRPSFTLADEIKSGSYYGNRPEIQTYKCGWWIADDKRALKDSLKEAINKSTIELKDMGKRGRKLIEDKYNCDYLTQRYIDLFSWAVNGGKLPQACLE